MSNLLRVYHKEDRDVYFLLIPIPTNINSKISDRGNATLSYKTVS